MDEDLDLGEFIQNVEQRLREQNIETPIAVLGRREPDTLQVGNISYTLNDEYADVLPTGLSRGEPGEIGERVPIMDWPTTGTVSLDANTMSTGVWRSTSDRLADYMQEYLSIRNGELPMLINYNTSEREVQFDDIEAVILFREKLDRIIKEHYRGDR